MSHRSADYLQPYRDAVRQFGPNFSATLWNSREAQQLRFDVMIGLADFDDRVILDAGCSTGDFAEHLLQSGVNFTRYIGIDAVEELIKAARERQLPRCEFHLADLIHDQSPLVEHRPDWVCISGTLNTMDEQVAQQLVTAAFNAASPRGGVVFNFLSDRAEPEWLSREIGPARRFNTVKWIDWALSRTSRVSFTQDYMDGHDATIVMEKG